MKTIRVLASARTHLDDIAVYSIENFGEDTAERYIEELESQIAGFVQHFSDGKIAFDHFPDLLRVRQGAHHIYYRLRGDDIQMIAVLHQTMDADRHLRPLVS